MGQITIANVKKEKIPNSGADTKKIQEPKHVRTRGTDNRLVSDERNVQAGV